MTRNLAPLATWEDRKDAAISRTILTLVDDDSDGTVVLAASRAAQYEIVHDASDGTWAMREAP